MTGPTLATEAPADAPPEVAPEARLFAFLTDAEERAELLAVLGKPDVETDLDLASFEQATLDALASHHLRRMAEAQADLGRHQKALDLELELMKARYSRVMQPARAELAMREATVKNIASISDFGKKKSRAVAYGTFGGRKTPEYLDVVDPALVLSWAEASAPALVRVTVQLLLEDATRLLPPSYLDEAKREVQKTPLRKYFSSSGEDIPGTTVVPETIEWFGKPEPL